MEATVITADQFRKACGLWATGVSIVTSVDHERRPFGLTMNAVTSLSLDPPMFLVCVDRASDTLKAIQETGIFCVNVLAQGQEELSNRFAKKGDNKFSGVKFRNGSTGAPILTGALLAIECTVEAAFPGGDHEIFCGKVERIETEQSVSTEPLLYYDGRYGGVVSS